MLMISSSLTAARMLSRWKVWGKVFVWVSLDYQGVEVRRWLFCVYRQVQSVRQVVDYVDVVIVGYLRQDYSPSRAKVA